MQKNIEILINKIKQSDFTDKEKEILISKLDKEKPDLLEFLKTSYTLFNIGKTIREFFDEDISDLF